MTTDNYYQFGGNLPLGNPTYVKRKADDELYSNLKAGKFCYVLKSRQMGKSSLWVHTKQRLEREEFSCAAIDLTQIGRGDLEDWYYSFANRLAKEFSISNWKSWWGEHERLSPVARLNQLIEEVILASVPQGVKIVVFVDEIDFVRRLDFSTDDFFALIRSCYNYRSTNPDYNRLTFCLLGVATPPDLIQDKQLTPFNIGKAIELKGFEPHEVKPLTRGLEGKVDNPSVVMAEILRWTGGQPFLTQKLCQFVVEEAKSENPRSVEQVVRARVIENWEDQDEPEHLRTIRDRILRDERLAGNLLELYQQIQQQGEEGIVAKNSPLESELQLSGLVVKQQGKLKVYNPIYKEVFNQNWINEQFKNLRPYFENFRAWVASGKQDESRLLRGQSLQEALIWTQDKGLSFEDREFLDASQRKETEEEIAAKNKEAELERERKAKEVAEKANRQAQRRIRIGSIVLIVALLGAGISTVWGSIKFQEALKAQNEAEVARKQKEEATKEKEKAENKLKEIEIKVAKAEKNVEAANQKTEQAKKTEAEAKKQAEEAEKKEQLAKEHAEQALKKLNIANEQIKTLELEKEKKVTELKKTRRELQETTKQVEETKVDLAQLKVELTQIEDKISTGTIEHQDIEKAIASLERRRRELEDNTPSRGIASPNFSLPPQWKGWTCYTVIPPSSLFELGQLVEMRCSAQDLIINLRGKVQSRRSL